MTPPCQLRSTRLPPLPRNFSFAGAHRGGLRPNRPTHIGDSSSSARARERSLTLPVMPHAEFAPKSSLFVRNQEPITRSLPSSLRRSLVRSVFHHQGLARLGATPFRDAVTICGEASFSSRIAGRPRAALSSAARSLRRSSGPKTKGSVPRARHASWFVHSSRTRAACQATPEWFLQFNFQGPTKEHSYEEPNLACSAPRRRNHPSAQQTEHG